MLGLSMDLVWQEEFAILVLIICQKRITPDKEPIVTFCSKLGGATGTHKCWTTSFLTKAIETLGDMSTFVEETSVSSSMTVRLSPAMDTVESSV